MDTLILSPPACTPAEPPAGAFTLAAALAGHGVEAGLLDLSLELYHRVLEPPATRSAALRSALRTLRKEPGGYDPARHRSALGHLHHALRGWNAAHPGWKLTLMDLTPPGGVHVPRRIAARLETEPSPFAKLWAEALDPVLDRERPRRVMISLAYLSQLAATVDLAAHLRARGVTPAVGGSLIRSLELTGSGLRALRDALPGVALDSGDGAGLLGNAKPGLLQRLAWPRLLSPRPYLSARPIVPVPLSVGCYWRRCLYCPDRTLPHQRVPLRALAGLLESLPPDVREAGPVLHLLDSALPPGATLAALDLFRDHGVRFYGFARPTRKWLEGDRLGRCAEAGALMLQLGIESASPGLLARYQKGIEPADAERVLDAAAEAGIRTYLYLLFGLPGETAADREATRSLLVRRQAAVDFLNLSLFNLPRDCEMSHRATELGLELQPLPAEVDEVVGKDQERTRSNERRDAGDRPGDDGRLRLYWSFRYQGTSPRKEARRFLEKRLRPTPEVRAAIQRTPRWLRAAHLALMRLPGRREP
jgi:hypothetical protein